MNKKVLVPILILIVLIIIGVYVYQTSPSPAPAPTTDNTNDGSDLIVTPTPIPTPTTPTTTTPNPTPTTPPVSSGPEKTFTVSGANFSFTPNTITVNKGDRVKITFANIEGFHDFRIDEFHVKSNQLHAGGSDVVEFTADKAGTFEYYCSVGTHRQMGMKGTLTVK
jgi:plastocyanin